MENVVYPRPDNPPGQGCADDDARRLSPPARRPLTYAQRASTIFEGGTRTEGSHSVIHRDAGGSPSWSPLRHCTPAGSRCTGGPNVNSATRLPATLSPHPEAARFLGLSGRTLEKHRTYGTGPIYRKLGGRIVYALDDLQAWAERGTRQSTSDPGHGVVHPAKRQAAPAGERLSDAAAHHDRRAQSEGWRR